MSYPSNIPVDQRGFVDLRSDTVTRPTAEMYRAIAQAPLGDDVLGDEPTVARLEALACQKVGKEAAVFVPSGTMGNQIALSAHIERGDAILVEEEAHILFYECGAPAVLAGGITFTLRSNKGVMDPEDVERHVIKKSLHSPGTSLLCLENTHNRAGGTVVPIDYMRAYREVADRHGMKVHLDGARVFNAAVALGVDATEITRHVDTVNFCLSKGLGAPVGSLLCGPKPFIERARQWRKRLGGSMRQAGILAACGIVSLETMIERLADDHRRARRVASSISEIPGIEVDWDRVQTNMVLVDTVRPASEWIAAIREQGVLALAPAANRIRLVFHKDVDDLAADRASASFQAAAVALSS